MPESAETVLLVSDDPAVRQLLGAVLERDGMVVHRSDDTEDALRRIVAETHRYVVIDLVTRRLGPLPLIHQLQAGDRSRLILIVHASDADLGQIIESDVARVEVHGTIEPDDLSLVVRAMRKVEAPDESDPSAGADRELPLRLE